jgi:hypothetical protein
VAVHVDEVVTEAREDPHAQRGSESAAGSDSGTPDPQLAIKIHHAIALLRSRSLRLWAD